MFAGCPLSFWLGREMACFRFLEKRSSRPPLSLVRFRQGCLGEGEREAYVNSITKGIDG